jgi:hypothetical protein
MLVANPEVTMKACMCAVVLSLLMFAPARAQDALDKLVVNAAVSLVDERLESVLTTLEALAVTHEVRSADWETIKPILEKYQGDVEGVVWFAQPDGTYYTVEKGLQAQKLSDRPYFPRVLDGERTVGTLVTSKSTGRHVVVAAVPIKKSGSVVGVLGTSLYLDKLSESVDTCLGLPENVQFMAVTPDGTVALHRDAAKLMSSHPVADGVPAAESELTGWRFIVEE